MQIRRVTKMEKALFYEGTNRWTHKSKYRAGMQYTLECRHLVEVKGAKATRKFMRCDECVTELPPVDTGVGRQGSTSPDGDRETARLMLEALTHAMDATCLRHRH